MTDTLAMDLMPAQWFPDIELTRLAVGERQRVEIIRRGQAIRHAQQGAFRPGQGHGFQ